MEQMFLNTEGVVFLEHQCSIRRTAAKLTRATVDLKPRMIGCPKIRVRISLVILFGVTHL